MKRASECGTEEQTALDAEQLRKYIQDWYALLMHAFILLMFLNVCLNKYLINIEYT